MLVSLGISLAQWQTRRGDQKQLIEIKLQKMQSEPMLDFNQALHASSPLQVDDLEYRHLAARGKFISAWPVYLDNRPLNGVAGYYVVMPFKIAESEDAVLVARGWLPRDPSDRSRLSPYLTPSGTIQLEGLVRRNFGHVLQLGDPAPLRPGAILQNLGITELAAASKLKLQPFVIEQTSNAEDHLLRDWPKPSLGIERHRGYAFQWYALAAMALIFLL
ncbi:SURF1 family protein [Collimonas sp.]|jgi:cytochrome oxidase assembly protein ShyY1|uniref:SURF1 family protein n=1 Tax=Collimonas sp. TaxID=1963772 RepID=UPI0037C0171B